jgi:hypothetical protein
MKKLLLLARALAVVPAFSSAAAHSATLAQRVSALEANGDELIGESATHVHDETDSGNSDSLTDLGSTVGSTGFRGDTVVRVLGSHGQEHVDLPVQVGLDAHSELVGRSRRPRARSRSWTSTPARPRS